jgi:hypothetical protein
MDEPTFNYDVDPPDEIIAELWRARAELWEEFGNDWEALHAACRKSAEENNLPPPITLDDPMHPLNIRRRREAAGTLWKPPEEKEKGR